MLKPGLVVHPYSLFQTSWHLKIKGDEVSNYPRDFTSISKENLNYIFINEYKPVIYNFKKNKIDIK